MCNTNDMVRKDYVHNCYVTYYYYCSGCGQYVYGNHICSGNVTYDYSPTFPYKNYKCPKCNGEFSEPYKKFMGKFKDADIKEFGSEVIVGNTKVPIEKYVCPFCSKEMKGLNQ